MNISNSFFIIKCMKCYSIKYQCYETAAYLRDEERLLEQSAIDNNIDLYNPKSYTLYSIIELSLDQEVLTIIDEYLNKRISRSLSNMKEELIILSREYKINLICGYKY